MKGLTRVDRKGFAGFDLRERQWRERDFEILANGARQFGGGWPRDFYFDERFLWRCFGPDQPCALSLVLTAIASVNEARPATREHRLLPGVRILPRVYRLDDLLDGCDGSAAAVQSSTAGSSLIVIDEFALLHPRLRPVAKLLGGQRRNLVVAISGSDPARTDTRSLLDDSSFLNLGSLLLRFDVHRNPRCEVAVNSVQRLRRWLQFAIPDLLSLSDSQEAVPEYADDAERLCRATRNQP